MELMSSELRLWAPPAVGGHDPCATLSICAASSATIYTEENRQQRMKLSYVKNPVEMNLQYYSVFKLGDRSVDDFEDKESVNMCHKTHHHT